jgi:hypothetical protein
MATPAAPSQRESQSLNRGGTQVVAGVCGESFYALVEKIVYQIWLDGDVDPSPYHIA